MFLFLTERMRLSLSPHPQLSVIALEPERATHQNEFRELVEALHAAGLGVILDVVFNHTAESGADGPIITSKDW